MNFIVYGWRRAEDYDEGAPANHTLTVSAKDSSEAEEIGEKKLRAKFGAMDVVDSQPLD